MFEKLLQKILKDVVGEFIDGIDTKKLNIGIWSGTVEIVNVSLKPRLLAMLGLPYRITFSNISKLFITIPWKNLFTAPLVIQIDSILVLAQNQPYQLTRKEQGKLILLKIKQFIQKLARQLATTKKTEEKSGGYFESIYLKMLDNLYLTIKNIHFRFEVSQPLRYQIQATSFCFGITLQLVEIYAVDEKGNRVFVDRTKLTPEKNIIHKKLKLQNFGFYWNFQQKDTIFLSKNSSKNMKNDERFYKDMLDMKQIGVGKGLGKQKMNYIIMINAQGIVKQDNRSSKSSNSVSKYQIYFNIKQVKMILNQRIVKQVVWFTRQTLFISSNKNNSLKSQFSDRWEGPKNQNFLGLLRKYCINQFWDNQNNSKSNISLSSTQERMLIDYLYQNKEHLQKIQTKIKQIIVGDIGNKNAISKSQIISNWHAIESLMNEQKKNEGKMEIKFSFYLQQLCLFYVDEIKSPIAQLFLRGFSISANQTQDRDLSLIVQITKLQGFGYDQNPIIIMEHQIEASNNKPKTFTKIQKFVSIMFKSTKQGCSQELEVDMGGIGFFYDFKTFRQIYRLSEGLMSSQAIPNPISPASTHTQVAVRVAPGVLQKKLSQQKANKNQDKKIKQNSNCLSQVTITIDNISLYIQQYTKKTWRLSLSKCQLTNSSSFIPENILISAVSLSISDFYVLQPFSTKIFVNLREQSPILQVIIEPIQIKLGNDSLKNITRIPSCLETYKKSDAVSLSTKYGELFLLYDKQVWKKYDGVVIDGFLYLYQKNEEYSKYQLKVIEVARKQTNKRQTLQITVKPDPKRQAQKLILIVKNQAQFSQWLKFLQDLSQQNRKYLNKLNLKLKELQKAQQQQKSQSLTTPKNQKKGLKLKLTIEQLRFFMVYEKSEKQYQTIFGIIIKKTFLQLGYIQINKQLRKKPQENLKPDQSEADSNNLPKQGRTRQTQQQRFYSFQQMKFSNKFSKVDPSQSSGIDQIKQKQRIQNKIVQQDQGICIAQSIKVQVKQLQFWYRKIKRLYCIEQKKADKSEQVNKSKQNYSMMVDIQMQAYETRVQISMNNKITLNYQPYQIIQIISFLNNYIFKLFAIQNTAVKNNLITPSQSEGSLQQIQVKQEDLKLITPRKSQMKIDFQIKNGLQINCFNLLTYNKQKVSNLIKNTMKKQGQQKRERILKIATRQNLKVSLNTQGTHFQTSGIQIQWFDEENRDKKFTLVTNFVKNNKIFLQIINGKLNVKVLSLYLHNYEHQIMMRAIDYILTQLKQVLLYPFNFNQYFDQFCQGIQGTHTKMFRFKQYLQNSMTQSQIINRIKSLLQMNINIYDSVAAVNNLGFLTVGQIKVRNDFVQSYNYSIRQNLLCDQYEIQFKDVNLKLLSNQVDTIKLEQQSMDYLYNLLKNPQMKQKQLNKKYPQDNQQRFYTGVNNFENNISEIDWVQKSKAKIISVLDPNKPLDMSLSIIMFGKYPQYKNLYKKFELTVNNSVMKIALRVSEVCINLLPNEVEILSRFISEIMNNIARSDGLSYRYSYDEVISKTIYQQEMSKNRKQKLKINELSKLPIITIPLQKVLQQQEYIYCPIQFDLGIQYLSSCIVILPDINKNIPQQLLSKSTIRLTQKSSTIQNKQDVSLLSGIEVLIANLALKYAQYPQTQTQLSFSSLRLIHLANDSKNTLIQLTSAAERVSRQTMFIGYSEIKKQNTSQYKSQQNQNSIKQEDNPMINIHLKERQNQKQKANPIKSQDDAKKQQVVQQIKQNSFKKQLENSKKNKSDALRFKMRNQITQVEKFQNERTNQLVKVLQLELQNIIFQYDNNVLYDLLRIKTAIQQSKSRNQIKEEPNIVQQIRQQNNSKTKLECRIVNFMMKFPIKYEQSLDNLTKKISKNYNQFLCIVVKCYLYTELPQNIPLNIQMSYFQTFIQEKIGKEQNQKLVSFQENSYPLRGNSKKYRRKTLLQPTKIQLKRIKEKQSVTKVINKMIQQPEPALMKSRIKSLLNLASSPSPVLQKAQSNQQTQIITQDVILQHIEIDKCFLKISIQQIQLLSKLLASISKEVFKTLDYMKANQKQPKKTQESKKIDNKQLIKKDSLINKVNNEESTNIKASKLHQNFGKQKNNNTINDSNNKVDGKPRPKQEKSTGNQPGDGLKTKILKQPLKLVNKIQFSPLEVIIMNNKNLTNTPLIYSKLLIQNYDPQKNQFNLQIEANYFNLRINSWQPLIEKNIFLIKTQPNFSLKKVKYEQQKIQKKQERSETQVIKRSEVQTSIPYEKLYLQKYGQNLNINISTNFLQVLIPAFQPENKQKLQKRVSQVKSAGDEVNCWMLVNQLGYDIVCQSRHFKGNKMSTSLSIPNNKSKKLTFLNEMIDAQSFDVVLNNQNEFQRSQILGNENEKKNKLTISIIINNEFKIKQIDIGQIGLKKFCFNYEGNPYWIYGHTYMDISKNVRYVKFHSDIIIKNFTDKDLWIKMPSRQKIGDHIENQEQSKQQSQLKLPKQKQQAIKGREKDKDRKMSHHNFQVKFDQNNYYNRFLQVDDKKFKSDALPNQSDVSSVNQQLQTSFKKAHTHRPNYIKIPAKKQLSLAFDICDNFKRLTEAQFSNILFDQIPIQEIQMDNNNKQKDANFQSVKKFQKFQILKQRKKMRTNYKILPTGKVVNKLPQTINIALKAQQHILYFFTLAQDQSQFIYTPFSQLQISIHSDGFQWSNFTSCNLISSISLNDFNKNKLNIKTTIFKDQDEINTAILYPISVLYNDSDYTLRIRDPESKSQSYYEVQPKTGRSLSNNRIMIFKPDLPIYTGFCSHQTSYTKVYMKQQQITCKFEITSLFKPLISTQLSQILPNAIEAMVINQVSLKTTSGGSGSNTILQATQGIDTKFVTVSHKYYFNNSTQFIVLIRKYLGNQTNSRSKLTNFSVREYQPNSTQSFWLFQQDITTNSQNYFQLTIKNSPYQWSGALSITKQGNNHFILRNRAHFNDVIFMNLVVIKYHKIQKYKIELKVVQKDQVPFKIKNKLPGFLIKLPDYGNIILKQGDQVDYSWDQPVLKGQNIPILIAQSQEGGSFDKVGYTRFEIKTGQSQQNELIRIKKPSMMGQVKIIKNNATKIFQIRQQQNLDKKLEELVGQIELPIRIAIINNSFTPVYHLCDLSTSLSLKISKMYDSTLVKLNLDSIQLDNQTRYRVYFPVVLSTSLSINACIGRNIQLQLLAKPIILNIQQDFGRDLYATAMLITTLGIQKKGIQGQINRIQTQTESSNKVIISKLILPQVIIKLQVKTKKLSIETTINLQKPAVTKYPWNSSPYPIKNIAINLLSHLSISPWALISSFQKGVVSLLTQQESTKGIQGFFGQIIAAVSNSVSGLAGIIVGHDIERVDNFFDGIQQGTNLLIQQIKQIKDNFQPQQCTIPSIFKGLGYGLVSIVLKPIKGVLQMTLKTSEGIKKTALYSFQQSQSKFRQRQMIVFYGQQQRFRAYDKNQSRLMVSLLKACGQPLKYFHLIKFYVINNRLTNNTYVLCLGTEQVILINAKSQKLIWQLNLHQVSQIFVEGLSTLKFSPSGYEIDVFNQDLAEQICKTLLKIQKKVFIKT